MVSGTAVTDEPLLSPITGTPCVHCEYSVQEEWHRTDVEHHEEIRDEDHPVMGSRERKVEWDEVTETGGMMKLDSGRDAVPFYLRDGTGEVLVVPERAEVEAATTLEGPVEQSSPHYEVQGIKGLPFPYSTYSTGVRQMSEAVVPTDARVTVVGPVEIEDGTPQIRWTRRRGPSAKNRFLITLDEAGTAERSERRQMTRHLAIAAACVVGIIVVFALAAS